jgi:hypothetical protein
MPEMSTIGTSELRWTAELRDDHERPPELSSPT